MLYRAQDCWTVFPEPRIHVSPFRGQGILEKMHRVQAYVHVKGPASTGRGPSERGFLSSGCIHFVYDSRQDTRAQLSVFVSSSFPLLPL